MLITNLRRDYNDFFSTKKIQHDSKVSNPVKTRPRSLGITILPVWDENPSQVYPWLVRLPLHYAGTY